MRGLHALIAGLSFAAWSSFAKACDCGTWGTIEFNATRATTAAVIRVVEAKLDSNGYEVVYRFETVGDLRGELPSGETRAGFSHCCGTRVDVGHHYLVLLGRDDAFLRIHPGNALPLGARHDARRMQWLVSKLEGPEGLDRWRPYPDRWMWTLPPPPPPPCPER
jgi:hypothetical protein